MKKSRNRSRWVMPLVLALFASLLLASPGHSMQERQGKKGGGGGSGGGGGGSEDIPVMMVFRDLTTDKWRSDDQGAYENSLAKIEALIKTGGRGDNSYRYFNIRFAARKGKAWTWERKVSLDLGAALPAGVDPDKPKWMTVLATDCAGGNLVGGLFALTPPPGNGECAKILLDHFDFQGDWSWRTWADNFEPGMAEVTCVGEAGSGPSATCNAWVFGPHRAFPFEDQAYVHFEESSSDTDEVVVPFAAAICVMADYDAVQCALQAGFQ